MSEISQDSGSVSEASPSTPAPETTAAPSTPAETTAAPDTASVEPKPDQSPAEFIRKKAAKVQKAQSTPVIPAGAQAPVVPAATAPAVTDPAAAVTPPAPVWAPNFKYKAYGQEHEIPEMFRGIIKDAASEEEVRKVFNRAGGYAEAIKRYEQTKQEMDGLKPAREFFDKWSANAELYNKKDATGKRTHLAQFFNSVGVDDDAVFQYARERMLFNTLPEEQKAAIMQGIDAQRENMELSKRVSSFEQTEIAKASQTREVELSTELTKPGVAEVVKAYDAAKGPGAFRDLVVVTAQRGVQMAQKDISVGEVVGSLVDHFKPFVSAQQAARPVEAPKPKPVIPAIAGGTTTPARKVFTSVEDLRKHAKELQLAGN